MTIAFWSCTRGGGATSLLAAVSTIWSELYEETVIVSANHVCEDGITCILRESLKREKRDQEKPRFCFGEPEYYRRLHLDPLYQGYVRNSKLRFLPMEGREELDYFTGNGLTELQRKLRREEILMLDIYSGENRENHRFFREADLTVIVLPGQREQVEALMKSKEINRSKTIYVFGHTCSEEVYDIDWLSETFGVEKTHIFTIPYRKEAVQILWEGQWIHKLLHFLNGRTEEECADMVCPYRKITEAIHRFYQERRDAVVSNT